MTFTLILDTGDADAYLKVNDPDDLLYQKISALA
jgi:hypothetical protein